MVNAVRIDGTGLVGDKDGGAMRSRTCSTSSTAT
jgi:hypothetical protein